MEDEKSFMKN